jgi:hypothetical protein
MEAYALVNNRPWSDNDDTVAWSIRRLLVSLNDRCTDAARQKLKVLIPVVIGTATRGDERRRAYMIADWACRVVAPMALRAVKREADAATLAEMPEIIGSVTAEAAKLKCREVRDRIRAYAAYAATDAYAAAYAATAAYAAAADAYAAAYAAADTAAYAAYAADTAAYAATDAYAAYAYAAYAAYAACAAGTRQKAREQARETMWAAIIESAVELVRKLSA